jgi:hypothetical protein
MIPFEQRMRQGGSSAIAEASRFFMGEGPVRHSLEKIAERLKQLDVPYVIVGGMALVAHGYKRMAVDVHILVDSEGLKAVHEALEGLGYVAPFAGSKHLRDTETSVRIEFLVTGQYPGDGKPKPLAFPDPRDVAQVIDGVRYITLPALVDLKLASGMTNAGRLRDLADVQEVIRELRLPRDFVTQLNPFVRAKYEELWEGVAQSGGGPEQQ